MHPDRTCFSMGSDIWREKSRATMARQNSFKIGFPITGRCYLTNCGPEGLALLLQPQPASSVHTKAYHTPGRLASANPNAKAVTKQFVGEAPKADNEVSSRSVSSAVSCSQFFHPKDSVQQTWTFVALRTKATYPIQLKFLEVPEIRHRYNNRFGPFGNL